MNVSFELSSNSLLWVVGSFNSGLDKLGHLNLEGCTVTVACLEVISGLYLFLGILCHQLTLLRKYLTFSLKKSPFVFPLPMEIVLVSPIIYSCHYIPIKSAWIDDTKVLRCRTRYPESAFQAFSYYQGRLLLHIQLDRNIAYFFILLLRCGEHNLIQSLYYYFQKELVDWRRHLFLTRVYLFMKSNHAM
jgi:hypothetical protein